MIQKAVRKSAKMGQWSGYVELVLIQRPSETVLLNYPIPGRLTRKSAADAGWEYVSRTGKMTGVAGLRKWQADNPDWEVI